MGKHTTDTRTALLEAAELLFARRGYTAIGIREIADEAGANLASINYHFGSKHELYLATVRRVMARDDGEDAWSHLHDVPDDQFEAAVRLGEFVRTWIADIVADDSRRSCGALMLWEAVQPSEAIDAVVRDYARPSHEALLALVRRLLRDADVPRADLFTRSIFAQVLHYFVFRPFIERLDAARLPAETIAAHVTSFSLRAMGYDDAFIDGVLARLDALATAGEDHTR